MASAAMNTSCTTPLADPKRNCFLVKLFQVAFIKDGIDLVIKSVVAQLKDKGFIFIDCETNKPHDQDCCLSQCSKNGSEMQN